MIRRIDDEWSERIHERIRGVPDVFPDPRGIERLEIFEQYLNSPGRKPILMTGPSGTGKTELVRYGLDMFRPPRTDVEFLETFNPADPFTPIEQTIDKIRRNRNKRYVVVLPSGF